MYILSHFYHVRGDQINSKNSMHAETKFQAFYNFQSRFQILINYSSSLSIPTSLNLSVKDNLVLGWARDLEISRLFNFIAKRFILTLIALNPACPSFTSSFAASSLLCAAKLQEARQHEPTQPVHAPDELLTE